MVNLLEYQGQQHYEQVSIYTSSTLEEIQLKDQIKRDWCKKKNIPLLEIPYWERHNIPEIIDNFLNKKELSLR